MNGIHNLTDFACIPSGIWTRNLRFTGLQISCISYLLGMKNLAALEIVYSTTLREGLSTITRLGIAYIILYYFNEPLVVL
jgi:hypothetical protein